MATRTFDPAHTALILIDVQEKLLPAIHDGPTVLTQCLKLVEGLKVLSVPMIRTEQYPKGLGHTLPAVIDAMPSGTVVDEKTLFSACGEAVTTWLAAHRIRNVLLAGVEAHVCVMQTALGLIERRMTVGVVWDAVGCRRPMDLAIAARRLDLAGVVPLSVEMILLEMTTRANDPRFKAILPIIR